MVRESSQKRSCCPGQGDSGFVLVGSEDSENEHVVETKRVIYSIKYEILQVFGSSSKVVGDILTTGTTTKAACAGVVGWLWACDVAPKISKD